MLLHLHNNNFRDNVKLTPTAFVVLFRLDPLTLSDIEVSWITLLGRHEFVTL